MFVVIPFAFFLVLWGFVAIIWFGLVMSLFLIGVILLPFKVGLDFIRFTLKIMFLPFGMLAPRRR